MARVTSPYSELCGVGVSVSWPNPKLNVSSKTIQHLSSITVSLMRPRWHLETIHKGEAILVFIFFLKKRRNKHYLDCFVAGLQALLIWYSLGCSCHFNRSRCQQYFSSSDHKSSTSRSGLARRWDDWGAHRIEPSRLIKFFLIFVSI